MRCDTTARVRQRSGARAIGRHAAALFAAAGLAGCAPSPPLSASSPESTIPVAEALRGAWAMEVPDSVRTRLPDVATTFLSLRFDDGGRVSVSVGDVVEGAYRVDGRDVVVIAPGDTGAARIAYGPSRKAPLIYEMRGDTLWWRGGDAPVPLASWVSVLERERRLPAGLWRHAWIDGLVGEARLQLTAGGCARFVLVSGTFTRSFRVTADTLSTDFDGFLGIPGRSRYTAQGDTLRLDFTFDTRRGPEPTQLRFVRQRYEMLDPMARCPGR